MQFIKNDKLKIGMRLARPIYSKAGVLLFERNSRLTAQAIDSVRNFGLLGIYILEPAEPLPPMSEEDIEFERFQAIAVGSIEEELNKIIATGRQNRVRIIADTIIRQYGHVDGKINFYQNLRSKEDYVYRHSLNVAILCALMSHTLNVRREDQLQTVCAALVHDIGKLGCKSPGVYGDEVDNEALRQIYNVQTDGLEMLPQAFGGDGANIRRICMQAAKLQMRMLGDESLSKNTKLLIGAKILMVANRYDEITAMNLRGTANSEVSALREFLDNPDIYDPEVVDALIHSINILFPGVSIELSTGEKAMILVENEVNVLQPTVLSFKDNSILDLSLPVNDDIQVVSIMKTLDNRYIMDIEALRKAGYQ